MNNNLYIFTIEDAFEYLEAGYSFKKLPVKIRNIKEIALKAVKTDNFIFEYLNAQNRDDEDIAFEAIKQSVYNLYFASDRLKDSKEFIMKLIKNLDFKTKNYNKFLSFVSENLRDDKEVVLELVKKSPLNYTNASDNCKKDKDIAQVIIDSNIIKLYEMLPYEIVSDEEFAKKLIKINGTNIKYLSTDLRNNEEIILEAINNNIDAFIEAGNSKYSSKKILLKVTNNLVYWDNELYFQSEENEYFKQLINIDKKLLNDLEFMYELSRKLCNAEIFKKNSSIKIKYIGFIESLLIESIQRNIPFNEFVNNYEGYNEYIISYKSKYKEVETQSEEETNKKENQNIYDIINNIKKYCEYCSDKEEILNNINRLINEYNSNLDKIIKNIKNGNNNNPFNNTETLKMDLLSKLLKIENELYIYYSKNKNYFEMIDYLKDIYNFKNIEKNSIKEIIKILNEIVLPFINDKNIEIKLKNIIENKINEINIYLDKSYKNKNEKQLEYMTLNELEYIIRLELIDLLLEIKECILKKNIVNEMNDLSNNIINNKELHKKNNSICLDEMVNISNEILNEINGIDENNSFRERLNKIINSNINYYESKDKIFSNIESILIELYKLYYDILEYKNSLISIEKSKIMI